MIMSQDHAAISREQAVVALGGKSEKALNGPRVRFVGSEVEHAKALDLYDGAQAAINAKGYKRTHRVRMENRKIAGGGFAWYVYVDRLLTAAECQREMQRDRDLQLTA